MRTHNWKDADFDKERKRFWKTRSVIFVMKRVNLNDVTLTQAKNLLAAIQDNNDYARGVLNKAVDRIIEAQDSI